MTINNGVGFGKASALAMGGRGLLLALALAGFGLQGCNTDDAPAAPTGATDTPSAEAVAEDAIGADLVTGTAIDQPQGALAKSAPSCVVLTSKVVGWRRNAYAHNTCKTTLRYRLIWRFAFDGPCTPVESGNTLGESRGKQAYVTEVRGC